MVLSYLLESGERNHDLDALSKRLLDHTMIPLESLIGKGKTQRGMDQVPVPDIAAYAGEDADAAWRLEELLRPQIESGGLWKLYAELERPLIFVLARMEEHGVKVDVKRLKALSDEFAGRLEQIKSEIYAQAGRSFNISSGPQLRQVLFDELKLPVTKKTPKGEASTDADVLEELAAKHTLPRLIVQHRQLEKLKGTYLDALPAMVHGDGRIHSSFSQVVAATGRLSSSDPNLQNIPVRTEDGKQIRQAFVAGFDGWSMLTADYSQIELRVLAHFSRDEALMKAFAEDRDIHAEVAAKVYGVPQAQVTSQQRGTAKMVNFGVIYGLSAFGLAARLGIPQADAARFIDAYFREFAGVERFINATRAYARDHGRVETILGRRRAIQGVKNVTGRNLNLAERTAVNTVIQGSAADLIKKAMLLIDEAIRARGLRARMLLQIHDELVFEVPNEEIDALAELVRAAMTTALPLDVALKVDLGRGPNWLDTLDLD
jgi:DNA polymerase-1